MNDKLTKFLVVACLTLLIWTWAFLSQENEKLFNGMLEVSPATDPSLFVTFWAAGEELGQKVPLQLVFKGSSAKIRELLSQTELATPDNPQKDRLHYYYNPREFGHTEAKTYSFKLLDFLQQSSQTKGIPLTLSSCSIGQEPASQIEVQVEVLEKKTRSVVCVSETGLPIKGAITDPVQVEIYVPENYSKPAYVTLSAQQIELIQQQRSIRSRPYVEMGTNERRWSAQEVSVSILKDTLTLQPRVLQPFQKPRSIGYVFTNGMMGKYTVQMDPESESKLRTINIRATDEAFEAYSKVRYPVLIEIREEDISNSNGTLPPKEIIYNFPPEYVARREIELGDPLPPKTAIIKLIPVTPAAPANP